MIKSKHNSIKSYGAFRKENVSEDGKSSFTNSPYPFGEDYTEINVDIEYLNQGLYFLSFFLRKEREYLSNSIENLPKYILNSDETDYGSQKDILQMRKESCEEFLDFTKELKKMLGWFD